MPERPYHWAGQPVAGILERMEYTGCTCNFKTYSKSYKLHCRRADQERYRKMSADYEAEQERLKLEIETTEEWVEQRQTMGNDLDAFIALTKKYVDVTELTQTIVNEYIKKIIIHAPDKSGGKRRQKVEIIFNFVDEVEIPVLAEPMIAESTLGRKKRRDLHGHTVLCPNHKTYSSLRLLSLDFPGFCKPFDIV